MWQLKIVKNKHMKIKVLFFGMLSEICRTAEMELENIENIRMLESYLWKNFPDMKDMDYRFAVNKEIIDGKYELKNGDEVALLPPFAGG